MRTALDTNILVGILAQTPQSSDIAFHLQRCQRQGPLVISAVVYSELLAAPNATEDFISDFLAETGIHVDFQFDRALWTLVGERYARYAVRRRAAMSAGPRRLLADFVIGAHAHARADRLMTYDIKVFLQDFPEVKLYDDLFS